MSRVNDLADRWPVIGPAVGNAIIQVALIWQVDLEPEVQATITGLGTILTALLSMTRAWKPTSVRAAVDEARTLGRTEAAVDGLGTLDEALAAAKAEGVKLGRAEAASLQRTIEAAAADAYERGRVAGSREILDLASRGAPT
jgi:hypothetical protein